MYVFACKRLCLIFLAAGFDSFVFGTSPEGCALEDLGSYSLSLNTNTNLHLRIHWVQGSRLRVCGLGFRASGLGIGVGFDEDFTEAF